MKTKKTGLVVALLVAVFFTNGVLVQADDHRHEYEKHEKYRDYDDDDDEYEHDDEDDDDNESFYSQNVVNEAGTWNIWTRTMVAEKEALPFTDSKKVTLKVEGSNKELDFLILPKEGEFFVPGKAVAQLLGAEATYYKTSKILAVQYQANELIFRADTNVVYDNKVKTPSSAYTFYLNNELYVPINTITNGLGYIAEWQESNQMFVCQPLTR